MILNGKKGHKDLLPANLPRFFNPGGGIEQLRQRNFNDFGYFPRRRIKLRQAAVVEPGYKRVYFKIRWRYIDWCQRAKNLLFSGSDTDLFFRFAQRSILQGFRDFLSTTGK